MNHLEEMQLKQRTNVLTKEKLQAAAVFPKVELETNESGEEVEGVFQTAAQLHWERELEKQSSLGPAEHPQHQDESTEIPSQLPQFL